MRPKHTRLRSLEIYGAGSLARQQKVRNNERIEEGGNVGLGGNAPTIYSFFMQIATVKVEATPRTGLHLIDTYTVTQTSQTNPYYLQT